MCQKDSGRQQQNKRLGAEKRRGEKKKTTTKVREMKRSYPSGAEKRRKTEESRKFVTKLTKVTSFSTVTTSNNQPAATTSTSIQEGPSCGDRDEQPVSNVIKTVQEVKFFYIDKYSFML
ncbi:hypothetical protein ABVT39_014748 [Epinephelus coioides]